MTTNYAAKNLSLAVRHLSKLAGATDYEVLNGLASLAACAVPLMPPEEIARPPGPVPDLNRHLPVKWPMPLACGWVRMLNRVLVERERIPKCRYAELIFWWGNSVYRSPNRPPAPAAFKHNRETLSLSNAVPAIARAVRDDGRAVQFPSVAGFEHSIDISTIIEYSARAARGILGDASAHDQRRAEVPANTREWETATNEDDRWMSKKELGDKHGPYPGCQRTIDRMYKAEEIARRNIGGVWKYWEPTVQRRYEARAPRLQQPRAKQASKSALKTVATSTSTRHK